MALVVLTGGARSGKSRMATRLAAELIDRGHSVIAVVFGEPVDDEMSMRIERHRAERPAEIAVLEVGGGQDGWLGVLDGPQAVLVDCLGTCVSQIMAAVWESLEGTAPASDERTSLRPEYVEEVERRVEQVVDALCAARGATIVVTNEVGDGVVPEWPSARLFRDILGRSNARLIAASDAGYLCVAGRAVDIRALPSRIVWPVD